MKIHIAQINNRVGDLAFNQKLILEEISIAESKNCDLVIFPEMAICGYPCGDLWLQKSFLGSCYKVAMEIANATKSYQCAILLGLPLVENCKRGGKPSIYNAALLIHKGEILDIIKKKSIPNYGVFDEARYFKSSDLLSIINFCEYKIAILICEDLWDVKNLYLLSEKEFDFIIAINASPYSVDKLKLRYEASKKFVTTLSKPLIYVNQVGGQDELVFDGGSFVMDSAGEILLSLKRFASDNAAFVLEDESSSEVAPNEVNKKPEDFNLEEEKYSACILGLRDYVLKSGFSKVILGISGGIDSALVAAIATDALGSKNITTYALPSRFNKESSTNDAKKCAQNLGVNFEVISIEPTFSAMLSSIPNLSGMAIENMQARIRGNILMSLSNSGAGLVLSCGNKSETACGYSTLYGDMCGAFSPIKDLYKTEIYQLAKWRNLNIPRIAFDDISKVSENPIPQNILIKAPTAELRENQKDSDSLPDYEILDKVLFQLIEEAKMPEEIFDEFGSDLPLRVYKMLQSSEYKRKQAAIGTKISKMSFDQERRFPIVNKILQ